jgi:hypothetical protein
VGRTRGGNEGNSDTASRSGRGRRNNIFRSNNETAIMDMLGLGQCRTENDAARFQEVATVESFQERNKPVLKAEDYQHKHSLSWGFTLYWNVFPETQKIRMALVASRQRSGWLGFGMGTEGAMIGANAVIGWEDRNNPENSKIAEYNLQDKLPWEIKPVQEMGLPGMDVTNMEWVSNGRDQAMLFERPLLTSSGLANIYQGEEYTIIYALGNVPRPVDDYFGYHQFRDVAKKVIFWPYPEDDGL